MKKMTVLFAMALLLGFPLAAMSETTFSGSEEPDGKDVIGIVSQFRTSTNVLLIAKGGASSYAACSGHKNGDRAYGSSSGDAKLYWAPKDVGAEVTFLPSKSDSSAFIQGGTVQDPWTAL